MKMFVIRNVSTTCHVLFPPDHEFTLYYLTLNLIFDIKL